MCKKKSQCDSNPFLALCSNIFSRRLGAAWRTSTPSSSARMSKAESAILNVVLELLTLGNTRLCLPVEFITCSLTYSPMVEPNNSRIEGMPHTVSQQSRLWNVLEPHVYAKDAHNSGNRYGIGQTTSSKHYQERDSESNGSIFLET